MKTLNLAQGTPAWHAHRRNAHNASDAPAMLGISPYKKRSELLKERAIGITPDIDAATQRRFDDGHRFEEMARPLAEEILGGDNYLYPCTGTTDDGRLSASFDGLTADNRFAFEHKTLNATLRAVMTPDCTGADLPEHYRAQMEHQMIVSGAESVLFVASRWDGETLDDMRHCMYYPDSVLRERVLAGWTQFERDLADYQPEPTVAPAPVAKPVATLPVVFDMRVEGRLVACNIDQYKPAALAYIAAINTELTTDQEFADAEADARFCRESAAKLKLAIEQALGQMGDINTAIGTVREIAGAFDAKGLALEKLVKSEKDARREAIVTDAIAELRKHVAALNQRLGHPYMPTVPADFGGAVKGKRNLDSMKDAVNTELARAKIAASETADRIDANLKLLGEHQKFSGLFPDAHTWVQKASDDLRAVISSRIAAHEAEQRARLEAERERIAAEERRKAEAAAEDDRARIRAEEQAKAQAQARAEQERQQQADRETREKAIEAEREAQAGIAAARADDLLPAPLLDDLSNMAADLKNDVVSGIDARQAINAAQASAAQADQGNTITLGQVNALLSPIRLDAAGIEALGFTTTRVRAAVHLPAEQFYSLCSVIVRHVQNVQANATPPATLSPPLPIEGTAMSKQKYIAPAQFTDKPYVPIPMVPVESNQVKAIGYDADSKTLAVTFARGPGNIYHYPNVEPKTHAAFMASESKGNFFGQHIKPLEFDKFPAQAQEAA